MKTKITSLIIWFCLSFSSLYGQEYVYDKLYINPTNWGTSHIPYTNGNIYLSSYSGSGGSGTFVYRTYNGTAYSEIFVIKPDGKVGIGTTSPTNKLTIQSTIPNTDAQMNIFNPSSVSGSVAGIRFHTASGWNVMLRTNQNNAWLELVDSDGDWKHRWYGHDYYTMGKIGIGTTNPTEKLVVDGKILAEEVKVQTVPASDYVFEPDYNLRSLQELESFIRQNKHLPEIPSAEEFKENGVGLGEMDDMLLRKVEELTLYVIELKKSDDQKNKMIKELKKENEGQAKEILELKIKLNTQ